MVPVQRQRTKSLIEPLITTAAVLGILQGITWSVLSVIAILYYEGVIEIDADYLTTSTNERYVWWLIYGAYLVKVDTEDAADNSVKITSKEFNYFMYFYLILSFFWLIVSSISLWESITTKVAKYNNIRIGTWVGLAAALSLIDLVLFGLLAHDYDTETSTSTSVGQNYLVSLGLVALGIVMTLAMRGFVLWVINIIFAVVLGTHCYSLYKKGPRPNPSVVDAYSTDSKPPWNIYDSGFGKQNSAFRDDNDNSNMFSSSSSFSKLHVLNDRDNRNIGDRNLERDRNIPNTGAYPFGKNQLPGESNNNNSNNWNDRNSNVYDNRPLSQGSNAQPSRGFPQPSRFEPTNPYGQQQRMAKIGRQGGQRSPPLNVPSPLTPTPVIPAPDYSPPTSPRVRGVLRANTHYSNY